MTVLNRAKCCFIITFYLENVFRSILPRLVSKHFFYSAYKLPLLDISASVYKSTQNPLRSCISPGLITGILRYAPHYLRLKIISFLGFFFQSFTIGYLQLPTFSNHLRVSRYKDRTVESPLTGLLPGIGKPLSLLMTFCDAA